MKKISLFLGLALVCTGLVFAQFTGENTHQNGSKAISIEKALTLNDDAPATLRGNIVKQISKDKYLFRDSTGEIVVEIDKDEWGGVTVGPSDTVELTGEIDRDKKKVEFDADLVKKVN